jgi:hypothetical protein
MPRVIFGAILRLCRKMAPQNKSLAAYAAIMYTTYAVARQAGGLEGKPSKILYFLAHCGGEAAAVSQKGEILGRRSLLKPLHRVSRIM